MLLYVQIRAHTLSTEVDLLLNHWNTATVACCVREAGQTLLYGVVRLMKALACRCNVAVVCTNHVVGGTQVRPEGRSLGSITSVRPSR